MQTTAASSRRRLRPLPLAAALLVSFAALLPGAGPGARAAYRPPLRAPLGRGMVAADNADASRAGAEILRRGGNAVDAAVATALALGVVQPQSSGLGGGGFLILWRAGERKAYALDFRETAPAATRPELYLESGHAVPERSRVGGLAVAVPGEPAGLAEVEARFGKLGLKVVATPALRLAKEGFPVSAHLAATAAAVLGRLLPDDPLRALLAPGGKPIAEREILRRPELARTLELFAEQGAAAFYKGPVAREVVAAVRARGGVLTEQDLSRYRPIWREPLSGSFRGHRLYGPPPPAGAVTAIEALQIIDAKGPARGLGSSAADHLLAEALKHAFADRARLLGDPAFVPVPLAHLVDSGYARELAGRVRDDGVLKLDQYGDLKAASAPATAPRDHGTTHLCVADSEGNVVGLSTTVNLIFGSKLLAGSTGVVLNDQMDDFSIEPQAPNAFRLLGGTANAVRPGKRPLSSTSPLIVVKDDLPVLCAGGSGGPLIVSAVTQTVTNIIDHGLDAEAAVSQPRIHTQWQPDQVGVESLIPEDVIEGLKRRGHKVVPLRPRELGVVQTIKLTPQGLEGASDPRKGGAPAVP